MASLLELSGGQPQKQPKYVSLFEDRTFTGVFTQRAVLHDPADIYTSKYYGGRPDALWAGANIELTNRLTLQRRPGLSTFNTTGGAGFVYPTVPQTPYSFQLNNGTIRVIIDTGSTGPSESDVLTAVATSVNGQAVYTGTITSGANNGLQGYLVTVAGFVTSANNGLFEVLLSTATTLTLSNANAVAETHAATAATIVLTSVANASGGSTVYTGTISNGGGNMYAGLSFLIAGFGNGANNGTFVCTASSATTLTLSNASGVSETNPGTAISAGAVYWDQQNGTATLIWAKSPGAGATRFIGSGGILYFSNGVDIKKYTPLNVNGIIWNWGIVAPTAQPNVSIVASGAASTQWQANTIFSTTGTVYDSTNHQLWQLIGVNADPANNPNATNAVFGTSGSGGPNWNQGLYGQTTEAAGTPITWQNIAQLKQWSASTVFGDGGVNGVAANVAVYDPVTQAIFYNSNGGGGLSRSGTVKPPFSATAGWNFTESNGAGGTVGGVTYSRPHWFFLGTFAQMQKWLPAHGYSNWYTAGGTPGVHTAANAVVEPFILPPPTTGVSGNPPTPVYLQVPTNTGTSASSGSPFPSSPTTVGQQIQDGQLLWQNISTPVGASLDGRWNPGIKYVPWTLAGSTFGCIFDGTNLQVCTTSTGAGLSGSTSPGTTIASAVSITASAPSGGNTTYTLAAGSWTHTPIAGDSVAFSGFVNVGNNGTFQVVSATSNTIVVNNSAGVSETHSATAVFNPWGTTYSATTSDNGQLTWTCVGPPITWTATTIWNLPLTGFAPTQPTQKYGGSTIAASNATVQTVIISGKSGPTTAPAWGAVGTNTAEGPSSPQLTWFAESAVSTNSLAFLKGYSYGFSYKARALTDIYSPAPLGGIGGVQQIPPGVVGGAFASPFGSQTNAVSSSSPANTQTGSNAGAVMFVSGAYSTDPQVDTIIIWRSADGGGSSQMFELTEIPNVVGGGTWTFQDFLPDAPTSVFPGLNTQIHAPINGVNNPPPVNFFPQVYYLERIFGANGQYAQFSAGPDILVGNPDEAYAVADSLPFLAPVVRIVKSAQGLVTFLTDSIDVIIGGPATSTFSSTTWAPGVGLLAYNALDQFAGEIYFFSADNQFRVMTPSLNLTNAGFPIGDQFANLPTSGSPSSGISMTWDAKQVYVTSHQNGIDNCIFVGDGNTGWFRLNPRQAGAMPNTEPVWSPYAIITNGCQMVASVETSPGIKQLLVGSNFGGQQILARNLSVFTDNGTQYGAFFEMGNITLAHSGQLALLKFCEFDFNGVGFKPTVSYLLNEIAGTFTPFTAAPIFDPPSIYGDTIKPSSYSPNRYYFASNASLARCRHLRLKVDYGKTSNGDELFNATINGRLMVEA